MTKHWILNYKLLLLLKGKWHAVWMVVMIMMILLIYLQTNIWNCIILWESVPYDASEIKSIESSVLSRTLNSSCIDYVITVTDVMNAIAHHKSGKSDCSEGLFSDHFIHGTHRFYVILSILFTMIPIPNDKKK